MNTKTNQKGIVQLLLVAGILVALSVIGFVFYKQGKIKENSLKNVSVPAQYQDEYKESSDSVAKVEDDSDLQAVSTTLEVTDTTQLDTDLNQINSDLSAF